MATTRANRRLTGSTRNQGEITMTTTIPPTRPRGGKRLGRALAVLMITSAATVATAGAAYADPFMTTYFHPIERLGDGICQVRVGLDISMSESDALSFIAHPGEEATVKLYGDDPVFDNYLTGVPVDAPTWPQAWAGGYSVEFTKQLGCSTLNEDVGRDEIYAKVRFADFRNGRVSYSSSNVRTGSF
jgi:hypothetical protein